MQNLSLYLSFTHTLLVESGASLECYFFNHSSSKASLFNNYIYIMIYKSNYPFWKATRVIMFSDFAKSEYSKPLNIPQNTLPPIDFVIMLAFTTEQKGATKGIAMHAPALQACEICPSCSYGNNYL